MSGGKEGGGEDQFGFLKNVSSAESAKPYFFVTFNIIISCPELKLPKNI